MTARPYRVSSLSLYAYLFHVLCFLIPMTTFISLAAPLLQTWSGNVPPPDPDSKPKTLLSAVIEPIDHLV